MHPCLMQIQEMFNQGRINDSHPFVQEIQYFSSMYGNVATDPVRGLTGLHERYPGLMYLQERMRLATSGKAAYNIYLGKHGVGSTRNVLKSSQPVLPKPESVFHFGLAPSSWMKKQVCPALHDGIIIQFLLTLLDVMPNVTKVKLETKTSCTLYGCLILDQKGISPGADEYDGMIYGITPNLGPDDVSKLCENGYPEMLKNLIRMFTEKNLKWVKQVEVFMIQMLDICVAVPIASYGLDETGEAEVVTGRMDEVFQYANACDQCLKISISSKQPPFCESFCHDCFQKKMVCAKHEDLYDTWNPDNRPCLQCLHSKKRCTRFKVLVSVSDMDPSYEKYGKAVSFTFEEFLAGNKLGTLHLHDIGHNIKNAEASLERGTQFDGHYSYDSVDLAVVLSSVDQEDYHFLNAGLSHRAVLQYDKQSDELSLQRISANVTKSLFKVKTILKTDIPEQRRPWFSEGHDQIDKPLFVAVSSCGLVFASDDQRQNVFFYRPSGLPRKVNFIGKKCLEDTNPADDPLLVSPSSASNTIWKAASGILFFRNDSAVLVADFGFRTIRVIQCIKVVKSKVAEEKIKSIPITSLRKFPNSKISVHAFNVENKACLAPFGICETKSKHLVVADPIDRSINVIDVAKDLKSAICLASVSVFPESTAKLF
ncbi:uncharacterized protein [Clytia hemisphaerica]